MAEIEIRDLLDNETGKPVFPRTHVDAVIGLSDISFFEAVPDELDPTKLSVRLKPEYTGLWAEGWVSAGGVGTGGSGGGGLIETVYTWTELQAMATAPADDVTAAVNARGVYEIWQAVKALQNSTPNVSLVNGSGSSTITVNSVSAEFYTKGQVDNLIGGLVNFHYEFAASTSAVTNPQSNVLYLIGPTGSGADKYEEYVYTDSTWKKIGDTSIDLSNCVQKVSGATNGNFAGLDANGNLTDSGHKHGDYVTALGTNGNHLTWTKNGTTNNITVPFATSATTATKLGSSTVGSSTMPIYLNAGTPTKISSFKEAYLSWGGKDLSGSYGPVDAAMVSELGACRTMFAKAAGITVEYSTDAGVTWVDYGASNSDKVGLFSIGKTFYTGKNTTNGGGNTNNMLRVTLNTASAGIYTSLNKFVIYVTTNGSTGCYCTIRGRLQANVASDTDTWATFADQVAVSGWSGYNVINTSGITTDYSGSTSGKYGQIQFIFGYTAFSGNYTGLSITKIFGFGGVGWNVPSNMARHGHLYTYDADQNATFPAAIYANVTDSNLGSSSKRWKIYGTTLDLSSSATVTGSLTVVTATSGVPQLIFQRGTTSDDYIDWKIADNAGVLKFIYSSLGTDTSKVSISNNETIVNNALTVNGAVNITDAITLSGSTNTARRIYFGDSSHYLELDEYGFHFSHGVYSDDFVSAGGIGSSSTSGGALADLADVSLSSGLASGDLLKYDGTHWVNIPQSQIVPTVSVAFDDLTSHPTTLAGYGITDAKIENGVITLGGRTITPLTSIPDLSNTYLSLANGGTVAGAVDFGSGISGGQDWSINDRGEAAFADLTVNGSQVLTSHQTVTNAAATLTPGTTQTIATIGNTSITVQVPFFAMQQDIGTLNSYFTNGSANNALKLENHAASYFATATSVTDLTTRVTSLESMFEIVDGNVHVKNSMGLWSDSFISSGGVGTSGGGGGYGVEDITTEEDGTLKFHWTGGDVTTVDLNHTHAGLLPDVTSSDNGKIVKVVNGEWALAVESGGGSTVEWTNGAQTNSAILTVGGTSKSLLLTSGLVTSLSSSSTDYQVPSAKCVYDIVGDIETLLAAL